MTNSRIKLSKIVILANFRATKNSILVPTLISCLFHNRSLGHCRDKIEFNLKSQKLEEPPLFERRRFVSGRCTLDIRFCGSTRILNFLQLSRRLHFRVCRFCSPAFWRGAQSRHSLLPVNQNFEFSSTFSSPAFSLSVAFCSPSSWRGAETSKGVRVDKRNLQKSFGGRRECQAVERPSEGACRPRTPAGTRFAGGRVSGCGRYADEEFDRKKFGAAVHFPDPFE